MRLALSEGRLSKWQQLLAELTYHELGVLQAYAKIEPWGDKRADMREAWNTSLLMGSFSGEPPDPNRLIEYMRHDDGTATTMATESEQMVSPEAAAAMMRQMYPGTIK